jgi:hypothetical protein
MINRYKVARLELANKSKGGFWAGMAIASAIGGFTPTFIVNHWVGNIT